jgi:hypothetical protein
MFIMYSNDVSSFDNPDFLAQRRRSQRKKLSTRGKSGTDGEDGIVSTRI